MKKIISVLLILFILLTPSRVYAEETRTEAYWNGKKYDVTYYNRELNLLYNVDGFAISPRYENYTNPIYSDHYEYSFEVANNDNVAFTIYVTFPEQIKGGETYRFTVHYLYDGINNPNLEGVSSLPNGESISASKQTSTSTSFDVSFTHTFGSYSDELIMKFSSRGNATDGFGSFYITKITAERTNSDSENLGNISDNSNYQTFYLGELNAKIGELYDLVLNNVVGSLTSILEAWNTYLQNFNGWLEEHCTHIRNAMQDMSDTLDSSILAVKNAVTTIGSNIVSSITNMNNNLASKITAMQNAIVTKLDDTLVVKDKSDINSNNTANDELGSNIGEYDDLENNAVDDFNTSLDDLNTENKLLSDSDFMVTAQWVSTQLQNIYDSNIYLSYMIDFSLILGIALTIIGIKAKGG